MFGIIAAMANVASSYLERMRFILFCLSVSRGDNHPRVKENPALGRCSQKVIITLGQKILD
jgi:hypothetical protein